MAHFMH
jgi:hypothetical protein